MEAYESEPTLLFRRVLVEGINGGPHLSVAINVLLSLRDVPSRYAHYFSFFFKKFKKASRNKKSFIFKNSETAF